MKEEASSEKGAEIEGASASDGNGKRRKKLNGGKKRERTAVPPRLKETGFKNQWDEGGGSDQKKSGGIGGKDE
jgi:hypothetical protein